MLIRPSQRNRNPQQNKNLANKQSKTQGNKTGERAENQAWEFLLKQGMSSIARNYHCRYGEIDIITLDKKVLVFTEVRLRTNSKWGSGAETVDRRKQKKIIITAQHFLQRYKKYRRCDCRFDVIAASYKTDYPGDNAVQFDLNWIPNAFDASILSY